MTMRADYSVKTICAVLDLPRSSFYHRISESTDADSRTALLDLAGQHPTCGYRRLERAGRMVNHKRVQRLMVEIVCNPGHKRCKIRTIDSQHDFPRYPNRV